MRPARERILNAAERLYRAGGMDALSIRRVAADVGLTPMAIYRHYRDKDALVDALVAAGFARWEGYLAEAVRAATPVARVAAALSAYRDFALAEPRAFELMFLTPRRGVARAPGSLTLTPSPSFGAVLASVQQAIADGDLQSGDPAELILIVWSAAHGLIALHCTGRFGHDDAIFRPIYDRATRRLLEALRP